MSFKLYYQYCVVPGCQNNTKYTPEKVFIPVPREAEARKLWLDLAKMKYNQLPMNTTMYFCEDHFDLPNDMENYMALKVTGAIRKIRMRKGCVPSRCLPDKEVVKVKRKRKQKGKEQTDTGENKFLEEKGLDSHQDPMVAEFHEDSTIK